MKLRTTDPHVEQATQKFFEDLALEQPVLEYFYGAPVKEKVSEGYRRYKEFLAKSAEVAPEGAAEIGKTVAEKLTIAEDVYENYILEAFKEKIEDIFHSASLYVVIKPLLIELFAKAESKELENLLLSAMDEFLEENVTRFQNLVKLLVAGIPMEAAEEIAEDAGDTQIVLVKGRIECVDDDDDDDFDDGEEPEDGEHHCCCGGDCGGECKCGDEHEGHCQCDGGCKCGEHADE